MMKLFANLHTMFANLYLHTVDSDKALVCEVHWVAGETVFKLTGMEIPTAKADAAIKGLSTGEYNNILIVTLIHRK